jgi:UDP-N-acetylmuramoyl-tripeptide--D-alanyl-D-alanine ligase
LAEELGIEVVGYQTALYGSTHVSDTDEAVAVLLELGPDDAALVKGSRVARLEDVVQRHAEAAGC